MPVWPADFLINKIAFKQMDVVRPHQSEGGFDMTLSKFYKIARNSADSLNVEYLEIIEHSQKRPLL